MIFLSQKGKTYHANANLTVQLHLQVNAKSVIRDAL